MSNVWWYVARVAGLGAWALLMVSVVLGVALSGRFAGTPATRRRLRELHPWAAGTALGFLALHVVAVVADSYVDVGLLHALVPGASHYEPLAVGLGTVSLWVLVAVQVTSLARRRLSTRAWHGVHLLSYVLAVVMTIHAFAAGTDVRNPVFALPVAATLLVAALLVLERVTTRRSARAPVPPPAGQPARSAPTGPAPPPGPPATSTVVTTR
jgi:DMSO/TMAO reductase YedYZ heme-binding membrane subunit